MRFVISIAELDFQNDTMCSSEKGFQINSTTSVNKLKAHFFETLQNIGTIIKVDTAKEFEKTRELCSQNDVIFVSFHESPPDGTKCRLLQHTKGGLMVTGGFLDKWTFGSATMNIVTSLKQAEQLKNRLGKSAPMLGVFTPEIDTDFFRIPSIKERQEAKNSHEIENDYFHIVYAGRLISNKGICQLIRALNLLPEEKIRITIAGNFEPDFFIYQSNTYNTTFDMFFQRETIKKSKHPISFISSREKEELRELFWSADCFVYPSFHEDENFGITPREAILCGVPAIVSDFCGLGALSETQSELLNTYSSLGGVRFSISEFKNVLLKIIYSKENNKKANRDKIKQECNNETASDSLKNACIELLKTTPFEPIGGWRSNERLKQLLKNAPEKFKKAVELAKQPIPEGLYVDGSGQFGTEFSDAHFLTAIQSLYTTFPDMPTVEIGKNYHSFWRISLWKEEFAIVEFGFPGARMKRYSKEDWECLNRNSKQQNNELIFQPKEKKAEELIQELVLLGYIVPDIL
jgi:glycosyltransferase involved in cell wall biosynthesis